MRAKSQADTPEQTGQPAVACGQVSEPQAIPGNARSYDLRRPALVAVDLQSLFLDPDSPAWLATWPAVQRNVLDLMDVFVRGGYPLVLTRHAHRTSDAPNLIKHFFGRRLMHDDPLARLHPCIDPYLQHAQVWEKCTHAAFAHGLPKSLRACSAVLLVGVQTPLCIAATAMDLSRYGLVPVLVADACAAKDEAGHLAALRVLASGHAHIATARDVIQTLEAASKALTP